MAPQESQFLPGEEWRKIKEFFKNIQPSDITRYGDSAIGFHFPMSDKGWITTLFYFVNGSDSYEFSYHESHYDIYKEIENEWWIGERKSNYTKRGLGWIF